MRLEFVDCIVYVDFRVFIKNYLKFNKQNQNPRSNQFYCRNMCCVVEQLYQATNQVIKTITQHQEVTRYIYLSRTNHRD